MTRYKQVNNVRSPVTAEEEAQLEKDKETFLAIEQAKADAKVAQDALKASTKAKLIAGEALTEAEADTIVI
jgi:hypothetical protein